MIKNKHSIIKKILHKEIQYLISALPARHSKGTECTDHFIPFIYRKHKNAQKGKAYGSHLYLHVHFDSVNVCIYCK